MDTATATAQTLFGATDLGIPKKYKKPGHQHRSRRLSMQAETVHGLARMRLALWLS